jgi:hypothetical protein
MTKKDFNEIIEKRISLIRSTLASKGGEYTSEEDAFESFKTIAQGLSLHDDSTKVLWELLTKHLYSVKRMVESPIVPEEALVREKIGDAINYLILLEGLFMEDIEFDKIVYKELQKTEDRLSRWSSEYPQGTDQLGLPKMPSYSYTTNAEPCRVKYNLESGENGY